LEEGEEDDVKKFDKPEKRVAGKKIAGLNQQARP